MPFYNKNYNAAEDPQKRKLHIKCRKGENTSLNSFQRIGTIFKAKFMVTAKNTNRRLFFDVGATLMFLSILVWWLSDFLCVVFSFWTGVTQVPAAAVHQF